MNRDLPSPVPSSPTTLNATDVHTIVSFIDNYEVTHPTITGRFKRAIHAAITEFDVIWYFTDERKARHYEIVTALVEERPERYREAVVNVTRPWPPSVYEKALKSLPYDDVHLIVLYSRMTHPGGDGIAFALPAISIVYGLCILWNVVDKVQDEKVSASGSLAYFSVLLSTVVILWGAHKLRQGWRIRTDAAKTREEFVRLMAKGDV